MEIKLERAEFYKSISKIQGIVEKKNTMPVLANCLIRAGRKGLEILATDLDITIIDHCPAEVKKAGNVSLNARKLHEIFRELDEGQVELKEIDKEKIEIKSSNFKCDIQGINPDEFPNLPTTDGFKFFETEPAVLSEMIAKTIYAGATEEGRFTLNGIFMEKGESGEFVRFVATDGHRMAMIDREIIGSKELPLEHGVILPKKGMIELQRLLGGVEGKIQFGVKDNHIAVKIADSVLFMRLVDGEFPEYRRVIPEGNPVKAGVGRDAFLKSLKRASIMVDEKARSVKVSFSKGKIMIEGRHPTYGSAQGEAECDFNGANVEIGFNDRYLFDILNTVPEGKVELELKDEISPVIFRTESDGKYLCVIMPMRI
jgi:DNA polymerase III subunit beta